MDGRLRCFLTHGDPCSLAHSMRGTGTERSRGDAGVGQELGRNRGYTHLRRGQASKGGRKNEVFPDSGRSSPSMPDHSIQAQAQGDPGVMGAFCRSRARAGILTSRVVRPVEGKGRVFWNLFIFCGIYSCILIVFFSFSKRC